MGTCGECCISEVPTTCATPQHPALSFHQVMGPLSPASPPRDVPVNPYHVLQIRRDATTAEIRQSYKRLALWHHPGRQPHSGSCTPQERRRRLRIFELVAACYETLMLTDSRRRYDNICRDIEQSKWQKGVRGAMFVGGKPLQPNESFLPFGSSVNCALAASPMDESQRYEMDRIPALSRSSTETFHSDLRDQEDAAGTASSILSLQSSASGVSPPRVGGNRVVTAAKLTTTTSIETTPSLVDGPSSSGSTEEEEPESHYTSTLTRRLFGGHLAHLYKARNFEPFGDAFETFEQVFGSQIFPAIPREEIGPRDDGWKPLAISPKTLGPESSPSSPRSAGWKGTSKISPDGKSTIFITSRVLYDRRLTRTETVTTVAPGKTQTHVTVTTEPLFPKKNVDNDDDLPPGSTCLICYQVTAWTTSLSPVEKNSLDDEEEPGMCADFCELYESLAQELNFGQQDVYQSWVDFFLYPSHVFPAVVIDE